MPHLIDRLPPWTAAENAAGAAGLPAVNLTPLEELHRRIAASPQLTALTLECVNALAAGKCRENCGQAFFHDANLERFRFLLILLAYPAAAANYHDAGYSREEFAEVWRDLSHWGKYYLEQYGELRLEPLVFGWYFLHIAAKLIQLGRLQFQLPDFYNDKTDLSPWVGNGEPVIQLHIYNDDPLPPESCRNSLHRLREWLQRYRPDYQLRAVISHSWLFGPELEKMLPERSNIRELRELGRLVADDRPSDILWRIFKGRNPESFTSLTSLQRKVLEHYRNGKICHYGYLVIPAEELANF